MWRYNKTVSSDELMHYGVLGMKWGHRKAAPITLGTRSHNKSKASMLNGRQNTSQPKRQKMHVAKTNTPVKQKTASSNAQKDPKKSVKIVAKKAAKILSKNGNTPLKATAEKAKVGLSVIQSLYNISDTAAQNRQMTFYLNTAAQMSPEYRRRFMYD